ncbi:MAG: efflux RND transporter periplasmic adaptor subunit [Thermodesulfobacteriota bacterium]
MKAYTWSGILIISVSVAGLFLGHTMGTWPSSAHAAEEASHAGCDHGHAAHGAEAEHTGHEHATHEDEHDGDDDEIHTQDPHAGHDHAAHGDEHSGNEDELLANDPHAGHDHAASADGICPEHQVAEAEDALCLSDHIGELSPGEGMLVRLASEQAGMRAGIHTTSPESAQLSEPLRVPARLTFARERLATLTPLASGTVHKVHVRPGTRVEEGELLVEISTPEIARLHSGYTSARAQHEQNTAVLEREKLLHTRGISAQEEVERARAAWSASHSAIEQYQRELGSFGLDPVNVGSSNLVPLRAPFAGVITSMETTRGEGVTPSSPLLSLADPDVLWLELSIPAAHAASVVPQTPVQASFDGTEKPFETELFHVDPALNPESRTLRALAQISNPEGRLKAGMFTHATLLRSGSSAGVSLPADAVQHIDGQSYIFIQREPDLFELRRVTTSAQQDGRIGISAGLDPARAADIRVVSARGFALKSEVLRARLGASCADH